MLASAWALVGRVSLAMAVALADRGPAVHAGSLWPPPDATRAVALREMPYQGAWQCLCRSHHLPHLHASCAVDLHAKLAAVGVGIGCIVASYNRIHVIPDSLRYSVNLFLK